MKTELGDDDDSPTLGGFTRPMRIERNRSVRRGGVLYARSRVTGAAPAAVPERVLPPKLREKSWQNWIEL